MRASLTFIALLLVACQDAPPQATPTPSSATAAKSSAVATLSARATAAVSASATASPTSDAPAGDATAGKAVEQKHGEEYWAVYTAKGASQDEPAVKASIEDLTKRGLELGKAFGWGSLGCDLGAAAALKEKDDLNALGVYFANEKDANAFAATLKPAALGVAKIKAMCRD